MLHLRCQCGETLDVPESFIGEATDCPGCGKPIRAVASGKLGAEDRVSARLLIVKAPQHVGEQFFLAGRLPIDVGKLPEKPLSLQGTMVSRNHCRLVPDTGGWRVEDLKSTNGLFVNSKRIASAVLADGDVLRVGEYEMRFESMAAGDASAGKPLENPWADDVGAYDLSEVESTGKILPDAPAHAAVTGAAVVVEPVRAAGSGPTCPCCGMVLLPKARICIACGIKVPSGRPIVTSRGMDEDDLVERTRNWLQLISLVLGVGLLPIASEAFGTKKARSVWIIFVVTMLASALFLAANWGETRSPQFANFMLWSGSNEVTARKIDAARREVEQLIARSHKPARTVQVAPSRQNGDDSEDPELTEEEMRELTAALKSEARPQPAGEFHVYQLLTYALLHGGLMHFAGNMVFLLVFGVRVNELIGDLKFSFVYPLLAIAAGLSYMASTAGQSLHPMLGASGAVMGLAGMYFVLFPAQRVHMVFWFRLGYVTGLYLKMFRMRGFWLLALWIGFNDLLPMAMSQGGDHVAHWAHLGGFLSGAAIAIVLLVSRLATARGADLMSVALGRHAWPLLGKPHLRLEAPIASPRSASRRVIVQASYR